MLVGYVLLIVVTVVLWWMNRMGKLEENRFLLGVLMWFWLVPEAAIQMGWISAEIGRQPWIVQGLLRTSDAVSVVVPAYQIALTIGTIHRHLHGPVHRMGACCPRPDQERAASCGRQGREVSRE